MRYMVVSRSFKQSRDVVGGFLAYDSMTRDRDVVVFGDNSTGDDTNVCVCVCVESINVQVREE